jgi:hypothetical protein
MHSTPLLNKSIYNKERLLGYLSSMISKGICNKVDDFSYLGLTKYTIVKAMAKKKLNPPTLR